MLPLYSTFNLNWVYPSKFVVSFYNFTMSVKGADGCSNQDDSKYLEKNLI